MFRFLVVVGLGAALTVMALFFPWAQKEVSVAECEGQFYSAEVRTIYICDWQTTEARYWSDHLTLVDSTFETNDGEVVDESSGNQELRDYKMTGDKRDGNAGLFWARPLMWLGLGLTVVAVPATFLARRYSKEMQSFAAWGLFGSACTMAAACLLALSSMAIHAGTWAGQRVEPLVPEVGTFFLVGAVGFGLWGGVRFQQHESARLDGRHTPLAPILVLEDKPDDTPASSFNLDWLRWPDPRPVAIIAAVAMLLILATPTPVAGKAITLRDCDMEVNGAGTQCTLQSFEVHYGTWGARVTSDWGNGTETRFMGYFASFQDFETSGFVELVPIAGLVTTGASGWLAGSAVARRKARQLLAPAGIVTVGFAIWVGGIIHHSMNWAGVPAQSLRAGLGAIVLVLAGLMGWSAVVFTWRRAKEEATQ